jgi:lipoprotein-anchoring transpeptidase ErfK/SrfK
MIRVDRLGTAMATGKLQPLKAHDRSSSGAAFSKSFWRMAVLTAAGAIGVASQSDATVFWPDSDGGFYQAAPQTMAQPRKRKVRHHSEGGSRRGQKEVEGQIPETAKPHGPLVIAISINKQTMKVYDSNGFFAETPVSTGMRGHPTPMGVFSVVQKEKLHHSNIYSGAPMPYMQRITWSGIAMHAGVLPGHPASHGCIRMPMAFALKMYGWTRMGARVVITPDELSPTNFSHPMLVAQKVAPQPVATDEPAAKADKATNMATAKPLASELRASEANLELRTTVGHDGGPKSLTDAAPASTPLREQTRTADASAFPITKSPVTMSDATSSGDHASARQQPVARTDSAPSTTEDAASVKSGDASSAEAAKLEPAKPEPATSEAVSAAAERPQGASTQVASADDKAVETTSSPAASPEIKSAEADADKADASKAESKTDQVKAAPTTTDAPKAAAKPEGSAKAATDVSGAPGQKKDQDRLAGTDKPAPKTAAEKRAAAREAAKAAAEAERRRGPISVFVSRKDSKLYVRQGFAPLFDAPVTIAPSDRPLGTHVFTAEVDKNDANVVHWSVVTLPKPTRYAERRDEDERASRRRKVAGAAEVKAPMPEPDSAAEALDRLTIPEEAKARITDALTTASSIIVSDQGIAGGETGQGTDFIVSLR